MSIEDLSGRSEFVPLVEVTPQMELRELRKVHQISQRYYRYSGFAYRDLIQNVLTGKGLEDYPHVSQLTSSNMEVKILLLDNLKSIGDSVTNRRLLTTTVSMLGIDDQIAVIQEAGYPIPSVTPEIRAIIEKSISISDGDTEHERQLRDMAIKHIKSQYLSQYEQKFSHS